MSRYTKTGIAGLCLFLFLGATSAVAGLIGTEPNGADSNFVSIDSGTGAATVVGATGFPKIHGLAARPTDFVVFGSSAQLAPVDAGTIITINPNTGIGTAIGPPAPNPNGPVRSLTFLGTTLYGACNQFSPGSDLADSLCTVSQTTGEISFGPRFQYPGASTLRGVDGIDFDAGGVLFLVANPPNFPSGPGLFTANTTTGAATLIGTVRDGSNVTLASTVGGLQFVGATLYGTTGDGRLITLNPATGVYTVVGPNGLTGSVQGLGNLDIPNTPTNTPTETPIATLTPTLVPTLTFTPTPPPCTLSGSSNPCAASGGAKSTDCYMEWLTRPAPPLKTNGLRLNKLICYEGDLECDFDANITNNECTFHAALCLNNSDPRLPLCAPVDVATFEVRKPNPNNLKDVDPVNLATLENEGGSGGFGLTVVRKSVVVQPGNSTNAPNLCSDGDMSLRVPLRLTSSGARRKSKVFRVRGTTSLGKRDADAMRLECRPSTCGNLIIESHETCDDGNRNNNDGCNQGCKIELAATPTFTPVNTNTPANTFTPTSTPTATDTGTPTPTFTLAGPANTPTDTRTPTATGTATSTATSTATFTVGAGDLCGNGTLDAGEGCDDGGACFGGSNEANACTSDGACPGGECRAAGGDGCASNCTPETTVIFEFTGAVCKGGATEGDGCSFEASCVGGVVARPCGVQADCVNVGGTCTSECGAPPSRGCFADGECVAGPNLGAQCYLRQGGVEAPTCASGADSGQPCTTSADCAGGAACTSPCGAGGECLSKSRSSLGGVGLLLNIGPLIGQQELRIGEPDASGLVPVASPANSTEFNPVRVPGLVCACVRGAPDPGAHGPNNSASGVISCGATPIANDVAIAIDHNTAPPLTCILGPNLGAPCQNKCAPGGTRAGLACAVAGLNATECPGTGAQRQCNSIPDCAALNACNLTNGPGICTGGTAVGRACFDNTQCPGGTCNGECTAGTSVGASCSCPGSGVASQQCVNTSQCGTNGVCRVLGSRGGGFCAGPQRFCTGGTGAGKACYSNNDCPGGGTCPATGNFLGYCDDDSDCPGSACASVDDTTACMLADPDVPNGSGDVACLEKSEFCTAGPLLGDPCASDAFCGSGGICGTACAANPEHLGVCNSPTRTRFSGSGGPGSALFLSTIQIGTISDGGTCSVSKVCAGGSSNAATCAVDQDCPGGACASALCNGFCSIATTSPCLVNGDCPVGGGVCVPGAMFNVPCPGTNPSTECGANAVCRPKLPAKGFDGVPCSGDDPLASQGVANTIPQTTGGSHASVADGFSALNSGQQLAHRTCIPSNAPDATCKTSSSGSAFNCVSLLAPSPSVTGVKLAIVFPTVDGATGDAAISTLLQGR